MVYRMLVRVGCQRKVRPSLHFFCIHQSFDFFFRHLVVGGGLDGHGILTASGGGTGCEGIRRGAGVVAVVVVGGGLDGHGVLSGSGGGTGAGVVPVAVVGGGLDSHGVCGGGAAA